MAGHTSLKRGLVVLALTLFTHAFVSGQDRPWVKWSPLDGYAIRQGYHVEWFRGGEARDLGQLMGEVAFVWSDTRNGDRGVYLQVISTEAGFRFKYQAGGLRISDAPNRQEDPGVWPTADGGWIIAWEDFDADSLGDIYCTKIDAQGRRLWGEGERGLAVCTAPGLQEDVRIVEDGQGGAIIAWRDMRWGDPGDIYAQHILSDGRIDPNWERNGIPIVRVAGPQISHTADSDGEGGMIIAWKDGRQVGNFDIWAQRITPQGELLWGQGQGVVVCGHQSNQDSPKLCPDGAGGAFIVWVDDRNQGQTDKDIYAQRVNAQGSLMWNAAGEAVCTEPQEQTEVRIVMTESGFAVVLWEDKRADGLTYDVYAMRISGTDRLRKEWNPASGVPVAVASRNQQQARLYPDRQGGVYVVWEDERERPFPEIDIWAQRISRSGQPLWQANGIPICRAPGQQHSPLVRSDNNGAAIIAWGDYRSGSQEIWGQKVNPNGEVVGQANGNPLVEGIGGNATEPRAFSRWDGSFTIFWLDGRFGGRGLYPFIQSVRDGGDRPIIIHQNDGVAALAGTVGGGINPQACPDGENGTIVVWEDHRAGEVYAIYAQRVSSQGQRLWGDGGIKVAEFDYEQSWPYVCPDGAGGAFIAWRAPTDGDYYDVYMQRLSPQGERLWGDQGLRVTSHDMDEEVEQLIPDEEGGAILVWKAYNDIDNTLDDLWITRVDRSGNILWGRDEDHGIVLVNAPNTQRSAHAVRHPQGVFVTWVDGRDDEEGQPQYDIFGQMISLNGEILWRPNGLIICGDSHHQENPRAVIDRSANIWVVWEDHRWTGTRRQRDIYLQKFPPQLNPQGGLQIAFERDGRVICGAEYDQLNPAIIHDGQNGVWVAWEDYRGGLWSDIYAIHLRPSGERYELWEEFGNIVTGAFHKQQGARLVNLLPNGSTGVAIVWEDKRATGKEELSNVYIQRLDDGQLNVPSPDQSYLPHGYILSDVYPNPFNEMARITFIAPVRGVVRLTLYNPQGQIVRRITEKAFSSGKHTVTLSGKGLSSGTYFLRLETPYGYLEQKVQLVR